MPNNTETKAEVNPVHQLQIWSGDFSWITLEKITAINIANMAKPITGRYFMIVKIL